MVLPRVRWGKNGVNRAYPSKAIRFGFGRQIWAFLPLKRLTFAGKPPRKRGKNGVIIPPRGGVGARQHAIYSDNASTPLKNRILKYIPVGGSNHPIFAPEGAAG